MSALAANLQTLRAMPQGSLTQHLIRAIAADLVSPRVSTYGVKQ